MCGDTDFVINVSGSEYRHNTIFLLPNTNLSHNLKLTTLVADLKDHVIGNRQNRPYHMELCQARKVVTFYTVEVFIGYVNTVLKHV